MALVHIGEVLKPLIKHFDPMNREFKRRIKRNSEEDNQLELLLPLPGPRHTRRPDK